MTVAKQEARQAVESLFNSNFENIDLVNLAFEQEGSREYHFRAEAKYQSGVKPDKISRDYSVIGDIDSIRVRTGMGEIDTTAQTIESYIAVWY